MDKTKKQWQLNLYKIINESDTIQGRVFDIVMVISIVLNSIVIIAETVEPIRISIGQILMTLQWVFVVLFTFEYMLRILIVENKKKYVISFFGVVDMMAILPAYISIFMTSIRLLALFRTFRLLRLFSILKMGRYVEASGNLLKALRASRAKITVFLFTIFFVIVVVGALMYIIEGPENGFVSIPESMYWAVVTVSTVGYGDISPQTPYGKTLASMLMIVGYGIIAVPTGIITSEIALVDRKAREAKTSATCVTCGRKSHKEDAVYCDKCGGKL